MYKQLSLDYIGSQISNINFFRKDLDTVMLMRSLGRRFHTVDYLISQDSLSNGVLG